MSLNIKVFLFLQKEKNNTYILALDGDTDFQPVAVMLLIDRLKLYPLVGAACGRIHPTGSGWSNGQEFIVHFTLNKHKPKGNLDHWLTGKAKNSALQSVSSLAAKPNLSLYLVPCAFWRLPVALRETE